MVGKLPIAACKILLQLNTPFLLQKGQKLRRAKHFHLMAIQSKMLKSLRCLNNLINTYYQQGSSCSGQAYVDTIFLTAKTYLFLGIRPHTAEDYEVFLSPLVTVARFDSKSIIFDVIFKLLGNHLNLKTVR